jgi:hypothetical protein
VSQAWVVDTNVGIVANSRPNDGDHLPESGPACARFLEDLIDSGVVAVDNAREIIREYHHKMNSSGQPGVGDRFLLWILRNQANPGRCLQVDIADILVPGRLDGFRDDEKFIRTALGCPEPRIAEAVDGLWWYRRADFGAVGIEVKFLCEAEIADNSDRKHGPS